MGHSSTLTRLLTFEQLNSTAGDTGSYNSRRSCSSGCGSTLIGISSRWVCCIGVIRLAVLHNCNIYDDRLNGKSLRGCCHTRDGRSTWNDIALL